MNIVFDIGNATLPIDFRALHTIDLPDSPAAAQSPAFQEVLGALLSLIERAKGVDSTAVPLAVPAPPPVASTCGGSSRRRFSTCFSPRRKSASPCSAKISEIDRPAAFSISVSLS